MNRDGDGAFSGKINAPSLLCVRITHENAWYSFRIEFRTTGGIVQDIGRTAKTVKTRDVRRIAVTLLVRSAVLERRGTVAVTCVNNVVCRLSPDIERKPRVDEDGAYAVENGTVETFSDTILFRCARSSGLVTYTLLL